MRIRSLTATQIYRRFCSKIRYACTKEEMVIPCDVEHRASNCFIATSRGIWASPWRATRQRDQAAQRDQAHPR